MKTILLLSLMLQFFFHISTAQDSLSAPPSAATTTSVSLTPEMSASSVSSFFSALATASPQQPGNGPSAGDVGSSAGSGAVDSDAGASGTDSGSLNLSKGGMIALIVVLVCVCIFGIVSSVLWYLAKKRSWEIRETIRRSARKVVTALTPRRSTFPKDVQGRRRSMRGLTKIDEVPNTPRTKTRDIEKADSKLTSFEMAEPQKQSKWAKKFGR